MFNLIFRSPWPVPAVLALLCFLASGWLYNEAVKDEAEAAIALQKGAPAPVSLNAFDPAKDIHPADEVHVIGWINTDHNYQLTETSRKRADVVRRMFVLFGPEDAADSKQARAVVLMPDGDVERFVADMAAHLTGPLDDRLVFSLNGTSDRSPTLDNMANDALAEKGLTKAPGFQFIEIWPAKGREAALAPDPTFPLTMAAFPGVPGLILLLVAAFKFRGRNTPRVTAPSTLADAQASALMSNTAQAAPKARANRMPEAHTWGFLGLAVALYALSTWVGSWQLAALAGLAVVVHLIARVKKAMDKGVSAVASALSSVTAPAAAADTDTHSAMMKSLQDAQSQQFASFASAPATASASRPETSFMPFAQAPTAAQPAVQSVPTLSDRLSGLGSGIGGKVGKFAGAVAIMAALYFAVGEKPFSGLSLPTFGSSAPPDGPASIETASVPASAAFAPAPAAEPAAITPDSASEPASAPVTEPAPRPLATENALVPAAASLRPQATADAPVITAPTVPAAIVEAAPVAEAAAELASEAVAEPVREAAVETAAAPAPAETAEPDDSSTFLSALPLPDFGNLSLLAPIAGAVLLAVAAFALMRGRQAAPPRAFAGKDPWERLARDVRGKA